WWKWRRLKSRASKDFPSLEELRATLGPKTVEWLIERLGDKSADSRSSAAYYLGTVGDARAVGPLERTLKDPVHYVRSFAAHSAATLGARHCLASLLRLLND